MKRILKTLANGVALLLVFVPAACSGFGRIASVFTFFGHCVALAPGLPGDYLRIAYYFLTLRKCSIYSRVSFGTILNKSNSAIGEGVYIGLWCMLGRCEIGDRTQIGDSVQIPSGRRQHPRDDQGRIGSSDPDSFSKVLIGPDCWIGTAAVVMEDVGPRSTVGAGSIVTRPVPADAVVAGNPARVIRVG